MMDCIVRARPLLGTLVEIRLHDAAHGAAARAFDAAFAEIAAVQRAMSFHAADSDLARINAAAAGVALRVDARTVEVLRLAASISACSGGVFDVTVAAPLVAAGVLPRTLHARAPEPQARWHDVEILDAQHVRLRRCVWLDLGGIAKGYAVDRALQVLRAHGVRQACVNAGGDLRVCGPAVQTIQLRDAAGVRRAALELADAAVATSSSAGGFVHRHGVRRDAVACGRSVSVVARSCAVADALTKVVLAAPPALARRVLAAFGAEAATHEAALGWQRFGAAA